MAAKKLKAGDQVLFTHVVNGPRVKTEPAEVVSVQKDDVLTLKVNGVERDGVPSVEKVGAAVFPRWSPMPTEGAEEPESGAASASSPT